MEWYFGLSVVELLCIFAVGVTTELNIYSI